jgi:hypothetical protein
MITECTTMVNPLSIFFVVGFGGWFGEYIKLGFLVMRGGVVENHLKKLYEKYINQI